MAEFFRVKIVFDGPDHTFLSTDTYNERHAHALAERIADQLGPDSYVEVERSCNGEAIFGRAGEKA